VVVFRFLLAFAAIAVAALGVAFVLTRDRKYLRWAWRGVQAVLIVCVAIGILYVLERVVLMA
jgi:hypothetical protein